MKLESIVAQYGMNDYLDMNSGIIYHLSQAEYISCINAYKVPVSYNGKLTGYCIVDKQESN